MNFSWLLAPETLFGSRSPDTRAAITLIRRHHSAAATKTPLPRILLRLKGGCGMGIRREVVRIFTAIGEYLWRGRGRRTGVTLGTRARKRLALVVPLALTGCATTHTRYVIVPCATSEQVQKLKDAEPEHIGLKLTGNAQEDFKLAAGNDIALRLWGEGLLGVIQGCTGR